MSDTAKSELEENLEGYKGKIRPVNTASLTWDKDLIFLGRTPRGFEFDKGGVISTTLISGNPVQLFGLPFRCFMSLK